MKKEEDLIDFAGPHCKVFQVTVSECHNFSLRGLKKLLVAAGHCSMVEGKLKLVDKVVGKTAFYWVVPNEREGLWKQKAPLRIGKENENEALLERAQRMELASFLEKCFDQYVLVMDNVPIEPSDNLLEETDSARQEVAEPDMSTAMKKHYNKLRRMTKIELRELCQLISIYLLPYCNDQLLSATFSDLLVKNCDVRLQSGPAKSIKSSFFFIRAMTGALILNTLSSDSSRLMPSMN